MTTTTNFVKIETIFTAVVIALLIALVSVPAFAHAASYAYVNQAGDVQMMSAANPETAIATAPNIAARSGVILLNTASDNMIVGESVSGI